MQAQNSELHTLIPRGYSPETGLYYTEETVFNLKEKINSQEKMRIYEVENSGDATYLIEHITKGKASPFNFNVVGHMGETYVNEYVNLVGNVQFESKCYKEVHLLFAAETEMVHNPEKEDYITFLFEKEGSGVKVDELINHQVVKLNEQTYEYPVAFYVFKSDALSVSEKNESWFPPSGCYTRGKIDHERTSDGKIIEDNYSNMLRAFNSL